MTVLFHHPVDYIQSIDPVRPGPLGLTGGDARRWTHEVRVPEEVFLRTGHLQAVFVARARIAAPQIKKMLRWCELEGVDFETFDSCRADNFDTLNRVCVDYILQRLQ